MTPTTFCFSSLSIKKLKQVAAIHGVDLRGCVEKVEIVEALRSAGVREHAPHPPRQRGRPLTELSTTELKARAREAGVDLTTCLEKTDLILALRHRTARESDQAPGRRRGRTPVELEHATG